jgi:hypothetical protein
MTKVRRFSIQASSIDRIYILETIALTNANKMNKNIILKINQKAPGIRLKGYKSIGDNHPPKK